MSARSRDLISATLISAGIVCAGEVHLAAGESTGPFAVYWRDWFDNERYHTGSSASSTGDIQRGYDRMSSGRGDVLLVGPGTHHVSTALTWSKDHTHLVGAVQAAGKRPPSIIQPHGAISPLINANSSGIVFCGLTLRNGQSTGSTACLETLRVSTNSVGFVGRNLFVWGPEDDTVNDSTSAWCLIKIDGGDSLFDDCVIGYGWPITGAPTAAANYLSLVRFKNSVFNASHWRNCVFHGEFKDAGSAGFLFIHYSPAAGVFHNFQNCQFFNVGSTSLEVGVMSNANPMTAGQNILYFDANCAFHGVTDIANATNEGFIKFSPAMAQSTDAAHVQVGLALSFDASSA